MDKLDAGMRVLDQSRIGAVLTGNAEALKGGPPVMAMLMQNANSAEVAPHSRLVRKGLAREDLFLAVHEQFMTSTAKYADIVLPATMFVEHDDVYAAYGHLRAEADRSAWRNAYEPRIAVGLGTAPRGQITPALR